MTTIARPSRQPSSLPTYPMSTLVPPAANIQHLQPPQLLSRTLRWPRPRASPLVTATLAVVSDVDALAPSSIPADEASTQRRPLLRRCLSAIKEQDCLWEVKMGRPAQEEGVSLAMIADDIGDIVSHTFHCSHYYYSLYYAY